MAVCFKCSHSSTPKNVAIAQKNAALDMFYGRMFKTRPLLFLKAAFFKHGLRSACFVVAPWWSKKTYIGGAYWLDHQAYLAPIDQLQYHKSDDHHGKHNYWWDHILVGLGLLLIVEPSIEYHNQRDAEEIIGIREKARANYDDYIEMV